MLLIHKTGDLFTTTAPLIAHGVSVQAVMGSGVALQVKNRYPECFKGYKWACKNGLLEPGSLWVYCPLVPGEKTIANLATQEFYGRTGGPYAKLEWVRSSLRGLNAWSGRNFSSVAMPQIASGLGGLKWEQVEPIVIEELRNFDTVEVWSFNKPLD